MMKRPLSKLIVKRISTSPYFKESFARTEKEAIESKVDAITVLPLNSPEPADILITNTHTKPSQISESDLNRCQLMIHPNSGYDNLEASFIKKVKFPVIVGNPIRAHAVANYVLSSLFAHYSSIPTQHTWEEGRKWNRKLLSDLSVVILGRGHIGSLLHKSLSPLVSRLQVYDPYKGLNDLNLKNVDVVLPACGLNEKNIHLINRSFLSQLNDDFLVINAARGQLIHTDDLIAVLSERPRAYAYLDVFENEPADFSLFKNIKNITLTSHIAGVYTGIDQTTANYVADVIFDFSTMEENQFKAKYQSVILNDRFYNGMLI